MNAARPPESSPPPAVELRVAVGIGVRAIREAAGRTQDDVARAARILGVAWDRTKVAALERGDKALSAEELILLPAILREAGAPFWNMTELFGGGAVQVSLSYAVAPLEAHGVADLLAGSPPILWVEKADAEAGRHAERRGLGRGLGALIPKHPADQRQPVIPSEDVDAAIGRLVELGLDRIEADDLRRVAVFAGEAEEKAARKLGESKLVIAAVAFALWGRSLTEERDMLVGLEIEKSQWDPDFTPRRVQAIRGHQTRRLLSEMSERIAAAKAHKHALDNQTDRYWEAASGRGFYEIRTVGPISRDPGEIAVRVGQLRGGHIIRNWGGGVRGIDPAQFDDLLVRIIGRLLASLPVREAEFDPTQFRQVRDGYKEDDVSVVLNEIKRMLRNAGLLTTAEVDQPANDPPR